VSFFISTRHIERIRGAFCDDALYKLIFTFTLPELMLPFVCQSIYLSATKLTKIIFLKSNVPIFMQIGTSDPWGKYRKDSTSEDQEVKAQSHARPKIDSEALFVTTLRGIAFPIAFLFSLVYQ